MNDTFFDDLSGFYDDMIGFHSALERRLNTLRKYVDSGMKRAADIGCGTGLDSVSLSRLGLEVTSFDPSSGMIEQAKKNAEEAGVDISFNACSMADIPLKFNSLFDLVVSLGNTAANIPREQMQRSLKRIHELLKPGGRLLIQILNYDRIKMKKERIVSINSKDDIFFIRFYDFHETEIVFNVLRFNSLKPDERELKSTLLYPYTADGLKSLLERTGFSDIKISGSLNGDEFINETSKDIVVSACR